MEFRDVVGWINENWAFMTLTLGVFGVGIEKTTWIKFNPYSSIFEWIGKRVNKEMKNELSTISIKVDNVKNELDNHIVESDKKEFKRIRYRILDFAKSLRNGELHTLEEFENIFDLYSDYHNYTITHGFENGFLDQEYQYILEKFKECQRDNSFLK